MLTINSSDQTTNLQIYESRFHQFVSPTPQNWEEKTLVKKPNFEQLENTFSNFSCMFLNPNNFFQFEF